MLIEILDTFPKVTKYLRLQDPLGIASNYQEKFKKPIETLCVTILYHYVSGT